MLLQITQFSTFFSMIIFLLILVIPGYFWTLAFYPEKKSLQKIERGAFSILFSITILPMVVLLENTLFGVPIDFFSTFSNLLILLIISILIFLIRAQKITSPQFLYNFFPKIKKDDCVELLPKF